MKVRLLHPATISLLAIILLIAAISAFSSPQDVSAQDEITATVTETLGAPPTIPFLSTMTTTVTATVTRPVITLPPTVTATQTAKPTITATTTMTTTVTATGTPTEKPTVTATITQKPTLTATPTATWKPTITATSTVQTYLISGALGVKGAGATISYDGGFIVADSQGNYSFSVPSGWIGYIAPFKPGYRFLPGSISITSPVTVNLPNQNFTTKPSNK